MSHESDELRQARDDLRKAGDDARSERQVRDDLLNAGISPRERLQRIETLLEGVDRKLDDKASNGYVAALEQRVRLLEIGGGDRVVEMRTRVDKQDDALTTIQRKLAYATGTLASVTVIVNAITVWLINH